MIVNCKNILSQIFTKALVLCLLLITAGVARAQSSSLAGFGGRVVSVQGNTVVCAGGMSADLSKANLDSLFGTRKVSEITPNSYLIIEEGTVVSGQSNAMQTLVQVQSGYLYLAQDVRVAGKLDSIDTTKQTITVLGQEIAIDANTQLLKRRIKKTRKVPFAALMPGQPVTVEAELVSGQLVARQVTMGLPPTSPSSPEVTGLITSVNGNQLGIGDTYVIDITALLNAIAPIGGFPEALQVGQFADSNVADQESSGPLTANVLATQGGDPFVFGALGNADATNSTITVLGRQIKVDGNTKIHVTGVPEGKATLSDLKVGTEVTVGITLNSDGSLTAVDITE